MPDMMEPKSAARRVSTVSAVANHHSGPVPVIGEPGLRAAQPLPLPAGGSPRRSSPPRFPIGSNGPASVSQPARLGSPDEVIADVRLGHSFDVFYAAARDGIAKVLTVTIGDADLAAEATDEAMVRAYQRWDRVGPLENPGGWVYRVALNWATSGLRRTRRATSRRVEHERPSAPPAAVDPLIDEALAALSVDHRAVVVCRYLLGWSEAQTAEALRLRPGTVKSRLSRATHLLQTRLAPLRDPER